jgi:hypothetical protein
MINEDGEGTLKMPTVQDQEPIQTFGSSGPDESGRGLTKLPNWARRHAQPKAR